MSRWKFVRLWAVENDKQLIEIGRKARYSEAYFYQIIGGFRKAPRDFHNRISKAMKELETERQPEAMAA